MFGQPQRRSTRPRTPGAGFKGASLQPDGRRWKSVIRFSRRIIALGYFESERSAGYAYDQAATLLHGTGAATNGVVLPGEEAAPIRLRVIGRLTALGYDLEEPGPEASAELPTRSDYPEASAELPDRSEDTQATAKLPKPPGETEANTKLPGPCPEVAEPAVLPKLDHKDHSQPRDPLGALRRWKFRRWEESRPRGLAQPIGPGRDEQAVPVDRSSMLGAAVI